MPSLAIALLRCTKVPSHPVDGDFLARGCARNRPPNRASGYIGSVEGEFVKAKPATLDDETRVGDRLVVLDEAQFIADDDRGINVELILTFLRLSRARGINPQLVMLSAVLGDVTPFAQWLDLRELVSETRPVPLDYGVLDRTGVFEFRDDDGNTHSEQLLPAHAIRQRKLKPSAQDVIVPLAQQLLRDPNERLIVFRSRRGDTEGSTGYLSAELGLPPAAAALAELPDGDRSTSSQTLATALRGGVAFHTSDLDAVERGLVETYFRDPSGNIRVLTSTSGMAAGINTPASTVIIVETQQPRPGSPPMSVGFVRNMAGRAGRFGLQARGRAIILADNPLDRRNKFAHYVLAPPEPIRSTFSPGRPETWVLRLLRQVERVPRAEVPALIVNTFGGYCLVRANPAYQQTLERQITALLERMLSLGLLEEIEDGVRLTPLGSACGSSSLSFESCLRLLDAARRIGQSIADPQTLFVLLQILTEGDIYVPLQAKGQAEGRWEAPFTQRFGRALASEIGRGASEVYEVWRRQKRVLITEAWATGTPIGDIEQQYSISPFFAVSAGVVRGIADATRFRLGSIFEILKIAFPEAAPPATAVDTLMKSLEFGVPAQALFILDLPQALSRSEMLTILRAGITTAAEIVEGSRESLLSRLPVELVNKLKGRVQDDRR